MRTTVDLDYDTLIAAKEIARMENTTLGKPIPRVWRQPLTGKATAIAASNPATSATGFVPFEARGVVVSNELIDRLRDNDGV